MPVEQTVQFSPDCVARRPRNGPLDDARRQAEFNERVAIEAHLPVPKPRHRCCERCVRGQLRGEVRDRESAVGVRVRSASIVRHQALQDGLVLGKTRTVPPASFILNESNRSARRQYACGFGIEWWPVEPVGGRRRRHQNGALHEGRKHLGLAGDKADTRAGFGPRGCRCTHVGARLDAGDRECIRQLRSQEARENPGAAADVEHAAGWGRRRCQRRDGADRFGRVARPPPVIERGEAFIGRAGWRAGHRPASLVRARPRSGSTA